MDEIEFAKLAKRQEEIRKVKSMLQHIDIGNLVILYCGGDDGRDQRSERVDPEITNFAMDFYKKKLMELED